MPTTKKPKIRQRHSAREENADDVGVRVLDREGESDVPVRVLDEPTDEDVVVHVKDAPPQPVNGSDAATTASQSVDLPNFEAENSQDDAAGFDAVPYLTSAVTHATLVIVLGLITIGVGVADPEGTTLAVIDREDELDVSEVDSRSIDLLQETASSTPVPTDIDHPFDEVTQVEDIEPPSVDTTALNDSPLHDFPNDDDLWSPVPEGFGPGGNKGGKGSQGTKDGTRSGQGAGGKDGAPSHAVRKGSFAAWTVPKDPRPLKPYKIIIQVTLPGNIKEYTQDDLKGRVEGTDGYSQRIPQPEAKIPNRQELEEMIDSGKVRLGNGGASGDRMARSGEAGGAERAALKQLLRQGRLKMSQPVGGEFEFRNGRARISVTVPGAKNRVQDRIEIKSRILDEEQVLEIEF